MRPPLESNSVAATALSLRALQLYGTRQAERIARASSWLRTARPRTTEERAMQLLGLSWAKAQADDIRRSTQALIAEQRQDGGWAQLPALESDAYATGQALVALHTAGHPVSSSDGPARRRRFCCGRNFPMAPGSSARARSLCNRRGTAAFRTASISGSLPPGPVGRRWPSRWRSSRSRLLDPPAD